MDTELLTITPQQVTPTTLTLFDLTGPTMPRAFNVLEGVTRGQILVEDPIHPSWAVVREAIYGTIYVGGLLSRSLLESIVQYLRQIGEIGMGCWINDPLNEIFPFAPDYDGRTLYFTERSRRNDISYQLPSGYILAQRDKHLFSKSLITSLRLIHLAAWRTF